MAIVLAAGLAINVARGFGPGRGGLYSLAADWIANGVPAVAAVACLARSRRVDGRRTASVILGVGIGLWLVGSHSDPLRLAFYPCAYFAIAAFARGPRSNVDADLVLDGTIAAMSAAALMCMALLQPVLDAAHDVPAVTVTYAVADILLAGMVVSTFVISGLRPARGLLLLGSGLMAASVVDAIQRYQTATGTYEAHTQLDSLLLAAMLLLAASTWVPDGPVHATVSSRLPVPTITAVAGAISLGVLVYGDQSAGPGAPALGLAVATIALIVVRAERAGRRLTTTATFEERRRIARDLHDGLAQEIAFISRNVALLGERDAAGDLPRRIRAAVERARIESRIAISALSEPPDAPLDRRLDVAAREVAEQNAVALDLDLADGVAVEPAEREEIVRIVCEAIANAARHSGASRVRVVLEPRCPGARIEVIDAGSGFDPDAGHVQGFGLVSMQERAEALGGTLEIRSSPGAGTHVELTL